MTPSKFSRHLNGKLRKAVKLGAPAWLIKHLTLDLDFATALRASMRSGDKRRRDCADKKSRDMLCGVDRILSAYMWSLRDASAS